MHFPNPNPNPNPTLEFKTWGFYFGTWGFQNIELEILVQLDLHFETSKSPRPNKYGLKTQRDQYIRQDLKPWHL